MARRSGEAAKPRRRPKESLDAIPVPQIGVGPHGGAVLVGRSRGGADRCGQRHEPRVQDDRPARVQPRRRAVRRRHAVGGDLRARSRQGRHRRRARCQGDPRVRSESRGAARHRRARDHGDGSCGASEDAQRVRVGDARPGHQRPAGAAAHRRRRQDRGRRVRRRQVQPRRAAERARREPGRSAQPAHLVDHRHGVR